MESVIPKGYRETYAGIIPEDWETDFIENVGHILTGSKNTQDRIEDGQYPFFVRSQTIEHINSYSFDCEAVLTAGDGVGTGKVFHYIKGKFDVHQRVYCITDFSHRIKGSYFYLYFSVYFYNRMMQMTAKSSVDSVRREMIARMPIAFPPDTNEQHAIATVLSDMDALIENTETLIAKKSDIKLGTMQQLLTGKSRLPGFSGEWEMKTLGHIGFFKKGKGVTKDQTLSGMLPCVRYGEIYTHHNTTIKNFNSWISSEVASTAMPLKYGDILFAGSGETKKEIGKCVAFIHEVEAYAGGDIVILRPTSSNPVFLGYYLNTEAVNSQKASRGQGDAVVHITGGALASIQVSLPPLHEQTSIAEVLSDMDAEISALERDLHKYRDMKQGMMQELLTGRTRLPKEVING